MLFLQDFQEFLEQERTSQEEVHASRMASLQIVQIVAWDNNRILKMKTKY
jgi:hypothetical protein